MTASTPGKGLAGLVFANSEFDGQFLRTLDSIASGGADIGECFVTARRIVPGDEESWYAEWRRTAEQVYAAAVASEAAGHRVSAHDGFLRAATYFRISSVFLFRPPLDPRFVDAHGRQRDAFLRAAALSEWRIDAVSIPYEGTALPGYLLAPPGPVTARPALIVTGGYDGTVEELYFTAAAALRRGYTCLIFDGPGQGGVLIEQGLPFRPDWEAVVTPVVDWLLTRPEADPRRIALIGRSWGGYLAPRAATAEHRIAALIADAAQYAPGSKATSLLPPDLRAEFDRGDAAVINPALEQAMTQSPFLTFALNRGMLTHGVATPFDYLKALRAYTIEGLADRITCPTLICEAENDVRGGDAKPLYDAITAPKRYILFTNEEGAGEHDEAGAAFLFSQRAFDWLDETLAAVH